MNNSVKKWLAMREQSRKQAKRQARIERIKSIMCGILVIGFMLMACSVDGIVELILK